jgi:hypothetical protein
MSTTMRAGVLGDCVPLPQCMLGIDNVHLLGYPLPDNPGGHDWAALSAWLIGGSSSFNFDKYLFPISVRVCSAA